MMNEKYRKHFTMVIGEILIVSALSVLWIPQQVSAGSYNGQDLALAILEDQTTLISSSYTDTDTSGHRQEVVLSSRGTMHPTQGSTFALLSTGVAGAAVVTEDALNPGSERGEWFAGGQYGNPRDRATLTLTLRVPSYMHYLYYDIQFFSTEYPEYISSQYNDKLTVTVSSPSKGTTNYVLDVNSGDFVLHANDIPGSGYDIFATSGNPEGVDWVSTTPRTPGADAGATALITREHPVSPDETVTVTFDIIDTGDNQFDSAAFIDNLMFSGFAKTEIIARKTAQDVNGSLLECGDKIRYTVTVSNTGTADQGDNQGNEFEDYIPVNATYVSGSATASSGTVAYDQNNKKITWNGEIPAQSSVAISFDVTVNQSLFNGAKISNQGTVYWDSNEDGTNDATELTDDPSVDDGVDQDNDGKTDDDDPTIMTVTAYEIPAFVTEDFSDDSPGGAAAQSYQMHPWFETSTISGESNFEVALSYYYSTAKSFKMKLRSDDGPQYWNYTLSQLNSDMIWWEAWFACGNLSESADLLMSFINTNGNEIAKLKFEYIQEGTEIPTNYVLKLSYWDPSLSQWVQLSSDYPYGYLYNDWYKIRVEKNGVSLIDYSLYRTGQGIVDTATANQLSSPFSNFNQVVFSSTKTPVVSPLFFWDEHSIGIAHT
ncbi:MAG: choice-of-anchor L domain-containing protein [Euryarchaeota archaeon]|nr:choice-of-anchor L domain-containing protein [Euryarchaeota archaeon]